VPAEARALLVMKRTGTGVSDGYTGPVVIGVHA
jgi:hypothetical protein